jgi:predicted permease
MRKLWKRLRQLVQRRKFESELADELRIHREMAEDAARRAGAAPEDARRQSARAFGGEALALEDSRAVWRFAWLDSLAQDIRYALRGFRKSPGFALTVVGTLGLGLGILATSFSVFSAEVLRPFAVRDPWSLYGFYWGSQRGIAHLGLTWREFTDLRKQKAAFSEVLGTQTASVAIAGKPEIVEAVSGNYFTMLGGRICMGRPILESDDAPGAAAIAVAGHDMWTRRFGEDPNMIGRKLYVRGRPVEVVGVACPEFNGLQMEHISAWVSLAASGALAGGPELFGPEQPGRLMPVGRLKPGVTPEGAQAALLTYRRQIGVTWPGGGLPDRVFMVSRATATPLTRQAIAGFLPVFVAFGLILLIACANVSNMMLARCLARRREIGIRISLGAGRGRVVRQLLTESLLLALPAAAAAFGVAWAAVRAVVWLASTLASRAGEANQVRLLDFSPDARVLAFLLAAAGIATLAFGLMPAIQATRSSLVAANRGDFGNDYRPSRLRNALVVVQVTVCSLLLISAAISLRSERAMASQDVGFDPRGGFSVQVADKFRLPVAERLRAEPRIASVGAFRSFAQPAEAVGSGRPVHTQYFMVSPEYFGIFRIPVVRGRNFSDAEAKAEAAVAVVSETAARRLWPGEDAVGRTVVVPKRGLAPGAAPGPWSAVVIGVARDAILDWDNQGQPKRDYLYFPTHAGSKAFDVSLLVGMKGVIGIEPARRVIESAVDAVAPGAADQILSQEDALASRLAPFRALVAITGFMGCLALLMTLSGIYGVLSYLVGQRRKEFGIRIALGAEGKDVARMVFRQSLKLAACGAALGALAAWGLARVIAHAIQPIDALDWRGYAGGILVVIAAAMAASWVPARRAVRVDPAVTLRCD